MNLHNITSPGHEAWVWLTAKGGSGRPLGKGSFEHLWLVERGTPPPLPDDDTSEYIANRMRTSRRYWSAFKNLPHDRALDPLCGRLKTTAEYGRLTIYTYNANGHCPTCLQIAADRSLTTAGLHEARNNDPWSDLGWHDRGIMRDPLTGL